MNEFRIFRALGMAFRSWFKNFIPFTLLAAVLYSPVVLWIFTWDPNEAGGLEEVLNKAFVWPVYFIVGLSTLLAPMLTYRVIQELNGTKVSMLASIKYGMRGVMPALILAVVTNLLQLVPFGGIAGAIITCMWFVAAPAAVAEKLGPIAALTRSAELTSGRRWGIFGLTFLMGIVLIIMLMVWIAPMFAGDGDLEGSLRSSSLFFIGTMAVFQMFTGIVEAVSYALLRQDKDGVTHDELAKVFE